MAERWLFADAVAAQPWVTKDSIYIWIAEKAMPAPEVARLWTFQASETDDWVRTGAASDQELPVAHPGVGGRSYADGNDEHGEGRR